MKLCYYINENTKLTHSELKFEITSMFYNKNIDEIEEIIAPQGYMPPYTAMSEFCVANDIAYRSYLNRGADFLETANEMVKDCDEVLIMWGGKDNNARYLMALAQKNNKPVTIHQLNSKTANEKLIYQMLTSGSE